MAKKIEKFMLSKELQDQIDQISNLSQIHLDQLDPALKTLLTNIGTASQGVISYDDSELRNRIISLEKNSATKTGWFNKTSDKLTKQMLNDELDLLVTEMQDFSDALLTKLNKSDADSSYRSKNEKIQLNDLSDEFSKNVRDINNKVNAINATFANLAFVANDIEYLKNIINDLPNTAITQNSADLRYRKLDDQLTIADFANDLQPHFRELVNHSNKLSGAASLTDLNSYRKKDIKIKASDLDDSIIAKLNIIDQLSANINARIVDLVSNAFDTGFEQALVKTFVGEYTILNKQEFQDYVQEILTNNNTGINTNNKAAFSQILFAIYSDLKDKSATLSFVSSSINNVSSQLSNIQGQISYISSLKSAKTAENISTLSYLFSVPESALSDLNEAVSIPEISSPGSTTIIQANSIGADYTEETAKSGDAYIGIATNAIHDCDTLMHLELKNVTNINASAIKNCPHLNTLILPSVTTIATGAFIGCDNIALIVLPDNYTITRTEGFPMMARIIRVVGKV